MPEYSKRDIAAKLGRSHRNITYWTDFGIIIPDVQPSQGRGIARIYSERNLIEFGMIDIMVKDYGIRLDSIRYILKILRDGSFQRKDCDLQDGIGSIRKGEFINFGEFYKSTEWGNIKDLLYIENLFLVFDGVPAELQDSLNTDFYDVISENRYYKIHRDFYIKSSGSNYNEIFQLMFQEQSMGLSSKDNKTASHWASNGSYMKIVWLGGVRNSALKKLGITLSIDEKPLF